MAFSGVLLTSVLLAAGLSVPSAPSVATDGAPLIRLVSDPGSGVRSVDVPLTARTLRTVGAARAAGTRTPMLRTSTYRMLGLTWHGADPQLRVRTRSAGAWSAWRPMPALTDLPDTGTPEGSRPVHGTEPLWVGPSDGVQVGVRGPARDLELVLIDPGTGSSDEATGGPLPLPRTTPSTPDRAPRPEILTRRDWGADGSWRNSDPRYNRTIKQVHVHHTATGNDYTADDVPGLIRGMYRYHTHNLGWSDIGYNFLVDRFGRTWLGRAGGAGRPVRGAHTLGFNNTSTGVAVIGNFEEKQPSDKVLNAVVRLAAWKLDRNDRRPAGHVWVVSQGSDRYRDGRRVRLPVIDGHRDTNQTACPGQDLYDMLPVIRRRTQARVDRY